MTDDAALLIAAVIAAWAVFVADTCFVVHRRIKQANPRLRGVISHAPLPLAIVVGSMELNGFDAGAVFLLGIVLGAWFGGAA